MAGDKKAELKQDKVRKSRDKFLSAAEYMFAEHGYEGAKIRAIADHSGVNLGALHHYFGSKEELFRAVCNRRLMPMNQERLRRFDALCHSAQKTPNNPTGIDIRELFRASIEPTFFLKDLNSKEQFIFHKFYGRSLTEPSAVVSTVMGEIFTAVSKRFFTLLKDLCPHLTNDEYFWRVNCIFGTYIYLPAFSHRITFYAHEDFDPKNLDLGISQIIEFLVAGMLAPSTVNVK